ncbi:hypothetical protein TIFTF001_029925 [Ficus carica]|uniref:Uncharacterized protein n=1 Tax=Ficus carica TaxID=3494 RepID=A0AA88DSR3_FICCA|nr:hypothetical protein TIFTF001_029925 [Ficus carica]
MRSLSVQTTTGENAGVHCRPVADPSPSSLSTGLGSCALQRRSHATHRQSVARRPRGPPTTNPAGLAGRPSPIASSSTSRATHHQSRARRPRGPPTANRKLADFASHPPPIATYAHCSPEFSIETLHLGFVRKGDGQPSDLCHVSLVNLSIKVVISGEVVDV